MWPNFSLFSAACAHLYSLFSRLQKDVVRPCSGVLVSTGPLYSEEGFCPIGLENSVPLYCLFLQRLLVSENKNAVLTCGDGLKASESP